MYMDTNREQKNVFISAAGYSQQLSQLLERIMQSLSPVIILAVDCCRRCKVGDYLGRKRAKRKKYKTSMIIPIKTTNS